MIGEVDVADLLDDHRDLLDDRVEGTIERSVLVVDEAATPIRRRRGPGSGQTRRALDGIVDARKEPRPIPIGHGVRRDDRDVEDGDRA
jgi:hypothetical protein